ncbi:MAG: hypothetical protein CMJ46_15635, partial [Planctomyces sp.]|nr:hypothetical protein [Planctomyces sp.]
MSAVATGLRELLRSIQLCAPGLFCPPGEFVFKLGENSMSLGKTFRSGVLTLLAAMFLSPMSGVSAATIADNIAAIQQVDQEATNNRAAAAALKELQNSATADDLLV